MLTASDGAVSDQFGWSVAISGDTAVVGAVVDNVGANADQGSAYVFVRSGVSWTQQAKLTAGDGAALDNLGQAVAISGDKVVVGAVFDAVGAIAQQGSAYLFVCNWTEQPQLIASDGAPNDELGFAVALSGDTAVISAPGDTVSATLQGSAYVFVRAGTSWSFQQKLIASDAAATDLFGYSVAISGSTIIVGAIGDDIGANTDQGSAYVFLRSGSLWTQQQKLTALDGAVSDVFGWALAVSGNTIVVGALSDDVSFTNQGSAYVFVRSGTNWTQQQKLTATDAAASDNFGAAVGISGDTVVVSAVSDDVGANADQGSAYVFVRSGTVWTQQQKLTASDGAAHDNFGNAVGVAGNVIAVGAPLDNVGANSGQGSVYMFVLGGETWTQQQQIFASDGAANDRFGIAVGVTGDTVLVGANLDDVNANADQGSAYVYLRAGAVWYEQQHLTASNGAPNDAFGASVAVSGNTIIIGAYLDDVVANANQGSGYLYLMSCNTVPTAAANNVIRQKGSAAATATIANVLDSEDPIGYLSVTVASTPAGILIDGVTNTNGVITASIAAGCNAMVGNNAVVLQVQDSDGGLTTATMLVNVTANTLPALGSYGDTSVLASNSTTVIPSLVPSDNGSIVEFTATSPTFAGILGAEPDSGNITIANARPAGTHVVTVTAIDNCGATISSGFILTVTCQSIAVNPSTIPAATAGSGYSQVFTQAGGLAPITFSLTGTLPTGLSFTAGTSTLSGTPTEVGSFPITVTATDRNNCSGSRGYTLSVMAPLSVWNGSTSSDWHTAANWTPNAVPAPFTDVLIPTSGVTRQPIIAAGSSSINALTIESSRVLSINSGLGLLTAADVTSKGVITGAGRLVFGGATITQNGTISISAVEFGAGAHALGGDGKFTSGIVTVLAGASVTLASDQSLSVLVTNIGGSFDASGRTVMLTGAGTPIFNSGHFTATGSTIVYQGGVAQVVTDNIAYNNLTMNNTVGVSLAGDTTASGVLNLLTNLTTGAFTLTMPASGTSTGAGDVIGNVKRTGFTNGAALSFGNPFNTIRFDSGAPPTDVIVNLVKATPPGFPANVSSRTYTITPNGGSGFSATLRLHYQDSDLNGLNESNLELWRFNGSTWQSPAGSATRDSSANWVEETGITAFSPWGIAGPSGPTDVKLISLGATSYDNGVMFDWKTGFEVDNLGFRIYRQDGGVRTLVNHELVAGSALVAGSGTALTAGREYAYWVDAKDGGKDAAFWLEDIDLDGQSTWHGPVYAKQIGGKPPARSLAEMLSQVGRTQISEGTHPVESFAQLESATSGSSRSGVTSPAMIQQGSLASSRAVKIGLRRAGWYRVTQDELVRAGLDPKTDPRTLQLYVDGMELPIRVRGEEDGRFDSTDAIEFYGVGLNTPSTDTRVYWLVGGSQPGLRISTTPAGKGYPSGESFAYTVERRDHTVYFAALRNGEQENFFGAVVSSTVIGQGVTIHNLSKSSTESAVIEVSIQGVTNSAHQVGVSLNGSYIGQVSFNGQTKGQTKIEVSQTALREGENVIGLQSISGPSDISLVESIRITYQHAYRADDDWLSLTAGPGESVPIGGFTTKDIRVFDVTDEREVSELEATIDQSKDGYTATVSVTGRGERKLLAITGRRAEEASSVRMNTPSGLRGAGNGADLIIISRAEMFDSLKALVGLRVNQGLKTTLVDIEDVYDEFSYGEKSPQSIRDFLSYAATSWKVKPRFVLLCGDASYDGRNYLGYGDWDVVPTKLIDTDYMETASDDWFADFNNDGIAEISVGRLPARSAEELTVMVGKIVGYDQGGRSEEVLLAADANDGYDFEEASGGLRSLIPGSLRITQVNRGRVGPEEARNSLFEALSRKQLLVNYVGHGSANQWRESLLTNEDAAGMRNEHLSMFVMMTCLNGYVQDPGMESLGESLMKAERGGAVAVWASSGMTLPSDQGRVNQELYRLLFNRAGMITIGEAVSAAKVATSSSDVRRTWILMGDPSMRLR